MLPGEREEQHARGSGDDVMVDEATLVALDALATTLAIAAVAR
jgi:hypothetical protein